MEQQFLAAYDMYADAIFRHCALRLGDRELGRDLMQETFIRVWQSLKDGTKIGHMRGFLYKVANHLIIDVARRRKLRTEDSLEEMHEEHGFDIVDPSQDPMRATQGSMVIEMIERLEEPYRTAIVMRYIDGLPPRDIAELLGVSPNVVSVRVHRGLEFLSALLNNPNPFPSHDQECP